MPLNDLLKALKDPTRRQILELLRKRDMTAGDIAACFEISKPSISHHLELLRRAGLVVSFRERQFIYYALNATVVDELIQWLLSLHSNRQTSTQPSNQDDAKKNH